MNSQEIFDFVIAHLQKQNSISVKSGVCQYRGDAGTSCAVGCLISDDLYDVKMEGLGVESLTLQFPHLPGYIAENVDIIAKLQRYHDCANMCSDKYRVFTSSTRIESAKTNSRRI
jgi:hypothetical protein